MSNGVDQAYMDSLLTMPTYGQREEDEEEEQGRRLSDQRVEDILMGRSLDETARDAADHGIIAGTSMGVVSGLLDPFRIVPGVGEFLDEHMDPGESIGAKIGHGVGYMAGFLIPAGAAWKISATALKGAKLLKTAKAFDDLGRLGNLMRGAGGGALLGVGMSEDARKIPANVSVGAASGGIGDMVMFPLMKMVNRGLRGAGRAVSKKTAKVVADGGTQDLDFAGLSGRAYAKVDELYPEQAGGAFDPESRYAALKEGVARLDLDNMRAGETRILHGIGAPDKDLVKILKNHPEIDFQTIKRGTKKVPVSDVLVAPKGQLDDRLVKTYMKNKEIDGIPWAPGQRVRWKGKDRILVGRSKGQKGNIKAFSPGTRGGEHTVPLSEVIPSRYINWHLGPSLVDDAAKHWTGFVRERGLIVPDDFYKVAGEYIDNLPQELDGAQRESLVNYFAGRQIDSILDQDLTLKSIFKALGKKPPYKAHPAGDLSDMAAQNGYIVDYITEEGKRKLLLKDALPGPSNGAVHKFTDIQPAVEWLRARGARSIPDMIPEELGMSIPYNHLGLEFPAPATVANGAMTMKDVNVGAFWKTIAPRVLPRMAYVRFIADIVAEQTGRPNKIFEAMYDLSQGMTGSRNAMMNPVMIDGVKKKGFLPRLIKIRGGTGFKSRVREEVKPAISELLENSKKDWDAVIERWGLNADEVKVAGETRELFDDLFKVLQDWDVIDLDAEDFLENYWPHIRERAGSWEKRLRKEFAPDEELGRKSRKVSEKAVRFIHEMERTGNIVGYMEDPFMVPLKYIRAAYGKKYMSEPFKNAVKIINSIPSTESLNPVRDGLIDYVKLAFGQHPESYALVRDATRGLMKSLKINIDDTVADRYINTLLSLNYGAFMGFRAGLALRNMTQTLFVLMPMLQDPVAYGKAIKTVTTKAGRDGAREAGAIAMHSTAAPLHDGAFFGNLVNSFKSAATNQGSWRARALGTGTKFLKKAEKATRVGLGSEKATIAGKEVQVGFYSKADELNRAISFWAQRYKTEKHLNRYFKREISLEKFNELSGLDLYGKTHTNKFHELLNAGGKKKALDYLGIQAANETQWVYQLGAGPAPISHGVGRLFGQYGTWPSWYLAHLVRIGRAAKNNQGASRKLAAKASLWSAGIIGAIGQTGQEIGVDLSRWNPMTTMAWVGGPMVDWMKDLTDIIGGVGPSPSPGRALSLGERGVKDYGGNLVTQFDPRRQHGMDITDPKKLVYSMVAPFTPGALFFKDMMDTVDARSMQAAAIESLGMSPIAGMTYPENLGIEY